MPKTVSHVERFKSGLYGDYCYITDSISGFADMAIKEANNYLRGAVSIAVNKIAELAGKNLTARVKGANEKLPEGGTLFQCIRAFVYRDHATAMVHVLGDQKSNDGTWRLRFFEGGTEKRYHRTDKKTGKKRRRGSTIGHYTGKIEAKYFFNDAINTLGPDLPEIMKEYIERKITEAV